MKRNEDKCREMTRNAEKWREMQRNAEKFREMLRNADMQRYPNDLHDFHDLYYLHDTLHTGMSYLISHLYFDQARPTAWGGWGYCDPLCNKGRNFGWEGQIKMLEVAHAYVINNILYNCIFCVSRC